MKCPKRHRVEGGRKSTVLHSFRPIGCVQDVEKVTRKEKIIKNDVDLDGNLDQGIKVK